MWNISHSTNTTNNRMILANSVKRRDFSQNDNMFSIYIQVSLKGGISPPYYYLYLY